MHAALVFVFYLFVTVTSAQTVPTFERDALIELYTATSGSRWTNRANWTTAASPCSWYGITCGLDNLNQTRVTAISLPTNNLNGILPSSIGNLTALTLLKLSTNFIQGELPSTIGNLVQLTELDVDDNRFTGICKQQPTTLTHSIQGQFHDPLVIW